MSHRVVEDDTGLLEELPLDWRTTWVREKWISSRSRTSAGCRGRRAPLQYGSVRLSQQSAHILVDSGDDGLFAVVAWNEVAVAAGPEFVWVNPSTVGIIMLLVLAGRIAVVSSSFNGGHCSLDHRATVS